MEFAFEHPLAHRRGRGRGILLNQADEGGSHRGPRGHRGRGPIPGFGPGMGPGFGPGFGPFGGPRGRKRRGDVRTAALLLIAEEPRNGYQIIQEIAARSNDSWKPSPGAIYPALSQLEDEGLIRPLDADQGKTFEITDEGKAAAQAAQERPAPWEQEEQAEKSDDLRQSAAQVMQAVAAIGQSGDQELVAKAQAELKELKRKLYQLLADA